MCLSMVSIIDEEYCYNFLELIRTLEIIGGKSSIFEKANESCVSTKRTSLTCGFYGILFVY